MDLLSKPWDEYYDKSVLLALATAVGRSVKVDMMTLNTSSGMFARVCVDVELHQPMVGKCGSKTHGLKLSMMVCTSYV